MRINKTIFIPILLVGVVIAFSFIRSGIYQEKNILSHRVDLKKQNLKLYWKDDKGENFKDFKQLKEWLTNEKYEELIFAMNGGMYMKNLSPLGLYIENGITKSKLNKVQEAYGNFYMQPNGVFYITEENEGKVCKTSDFKSNGVKYATQSGPMLLIDGKIHPDFRKGSKNTNIRNGVGVLPNGELIFAMSEYKINFYDFATFFKSKGCKNALYLDGFVSRTYLPKEGKTSTKGNFGVIIGETEKN